MTLARLGACLLVCASLALLPASASASARMPPQATVAKSCGTVKLALGKSIVRARRVLCADARRFVKLMLSRDCGTTRDCNFSRFTFRGFSCVQRRSDTLIKNSCTKGLKAISELHG